MIAALDFKKQTLQRLSGCCRRRRRQLFAANPASHHCILQPLLPHHTAMAEGGEHAALLELEAAAHRDVQQLAATPLADKARSQKLSAAIQEKLARIRALTRDLELEVEELDSDEERAALAGQLAGHKREYAGLQAALKDAALAQRAAALRSAQEERKELLAGGEAGLRQRRAQLEGDTVAAAEEVTGGLRRTRQVLAEELEHTSATLAAMEASHTALGRTRDEYHGQHRKLRQSGGLLGTLNWQNKSETYMLWMGLTIFLAVCAYIFQKRAGHFIPEPLKPSNLLGGLMGPPRVGKPLAAPPAGRLRAESPPHAVRRPGSPPPLPPQPAMPQPSSSEQQRWEEEDAAADAAVGRGRAPPPDPLRRPPLLPPDDVPAGSWEGEEARAAPQPYGGFTEPDEPPEEVQPVYQPPAYDASAGQQAAQAQGQAGEVEEHPPAEWPSGAPEPRPEEQQEHPGAAGEQQQEQQQAEQHSDAPAEQRPAAAEEQPAVAAAQQEPHVDDVMLPAVDAVQAASMVADLAAGQVAAAAQANRAAAAARQQEGAAIAALDSAGEAAGAAALGAEQPVVHSVTFTTPDGRTIAVDGPEFVRHTPLAEQLADEGKPSVDGEPSAVVQQEAEGRAAAEQAAEQQANSERAAEQQVEPERQEDDATQQQQQQSGNQAEEHPPAEWPSGAPEPRDEL
ncbi:hypothetical protein ABPG75_012697 [Micractinium tetrahymenae]